MSLGNNERHKHLQFSHQHHSFQGFCQTSKYLQFFSRPLKFPLKIPGLSRLFHDSYEPWLNHIQYTARDHGISHTNFPSGVSWHTCNNFFPKFFQFPPKILGAENLDFNFTILWIYRKYIHNATRYRYWKTAMSHSCCDITSGIF